ncbi:methyltransferase domain-containing protein [Leucobacter sp. W1153]|uniref:methyltransferase domain-containing protein n=1 Tax=Leucobacter sp. W1153 TaxID=3439064 RepID=UPI003F2BC755
MTLAERDAQLTELMDDPNCDPVLLRRTLQRFRIVNRLVAGWDAVYRTHLRPALALSSGVSPAPARILDIGCGAGDVLRRLVHLARRDGFDVNGVGIDPDDRALAVARSGKNPGGVSFRNSLSRELVTEGSQYDLVVSNHLLHHLSETQLDDLLADSSSLSRGVSVHSDIARGRLAYAAYAVGVTPLAPGSFLRVDGLRSIRRSYTRDELARRLPTGWIAQQPSMFRLLAVRETTERFATRSEADSIRSGALPPVRPASS